jgi:hypothetical protein
LDTQQTVVAFPIESWTEPLEEKQARCRQSSGRRLMEKSATNTKETDRGGLIQISTRNRQALQAIHEFLKFQINEHMTEDPLEVKGNN